MAEQAHRAVERATCAVLGRTADGIATHYFAALAEAERSMRALASFDKFCGPRDGMLPPSVRAALIQPPRDLRVPVSGQGGISIDAWEGRRGCAEGRSGGRRGNG
jgi:hypothetical protein